MISAQIRTVLLLAAALVTTAADDSASRISSAAASVLWKGEARVIYIESASRIPDGVSAKTVLETLASAHDRLMRDGSIWRGANEKYMKLAERTPVTVAFEDFFKPLVTAENRKDAASVAEAAKFASLREVLVSGLTDLRVILFNESPDRSDPITSSIFIVGKSPQGKIAGVLTGTAD